ncbi:protein ROOT INITIATION DEFECTIVE 3-like [Camellia sinensis]|uniref:protein ROOT INITIATION DEFECTIVE 3-like n=1 Tax=Camellia sinensis TaxID=4442 RepID=UPI001036654C|nr:protein ROOT INITIATION DEFECTIVE 3-like [Camellia sinensis]
MASSPLQEIILASSPDGIITAFDASSGTTLARFTGSRSPRKGLVVIGNNLIAASHVSSDTAAASIHLYNWWSSTASHHIPITEPVGPLAATFDGSYLFAGGLSGHVHALSVPSSDTIRTIFAHRKPVSCLAINDDGSLLFSGSDDGTIAVFPIYKLLENTSSKSTELVLHRFNGHESTVTSVTTGIGASNCTIISCSLDCTCKFWSLMHGTHLRTVAFPCTIWGVEMDPTESEFYVAGSDGSVYNGVMKGVGRHVVKQGHKLVTWTRKHKGAVIALAMMNGGQNLVTASDDGSIWIWDVFRKEVVTVLSEEMGSISELVVVKGFGDCGSHGLGASEGNDEFSRWRSGFTSRELSRPMREVTGMEQMLGVLARDRSKAIDTLGSAIQAYEKLLGLVLKEAKVGSNCDTSKEEEDDK